jgi:hypothetical protein
LTTDRIPRELRPASMSCPRCGGGGIQLILPGERGPFYFCGNKECLVARYGPGGVHSEIAAIRSANPDVEPDEPLGPLKD